MLHEESVEDASEVEQPVFCVARQQQLPQKVGAIRTYRTGLTPWVSLAPWQERNKKTDTDSCVSERSQANGGDNETGRKKERQRIGLSYNLAAVSSFYDLPQGKFEWHCIGSGADRFAVIKE